MGGEFFSGKKRVSNKVDWQNYNILESLFHAEDLMDELFICCYSDILFTPDAVSRVLANEADISLVVGTENVF